MTNKQRKKEQRLNDSTTGGSYNGNVIQNGQWNKCNVYCPECHPFNSVPHAVGCKGRKVRIFPPLVFLKRMRQKRFGTDSMRNLSIVDTIRNMIGLNGVGIIGLNIYESGTNRNAST